MRCDKNKLSKLQINENVQNKNVITYLCIKRFFGERSGAKNTQKPQKY